MVLMSDLADACPAGGNQLRLKRLGIDTHQEAIIYMARECPVCRAEGFTALSRVLVSLDGHSILATANQTTAFVNNLGEGSDFHSAGSFSGTRSFALRFTTFGSGNTNVFLQNNQRGQGSVRFGLANGDARLDASGQPGGDAFKILVVLTNFIDLASRYAGFPVDLAGHQQHSQESQHQAGDEEK